MPKNSKIRRILKDKTNISEYISDTEEDGYKLEDERGKEDSGSDSENSFIVGRRKHRSIRLPSYSDGSDDEHSEISADGTKWIDITGKSSPGRMSLNTIFRTASGPTSYAKRNIIKGNVSSAFFLIMNHRIIDYIITCTKLEAARVLGKKWDLSQEKFYTFIAILYAPKISRKSFLFQLATELSAQNENPFELQNITDLLNGPERPHTRKTCQIGLCNENKTKNICAGCTRYICGKCIFRTISLCKHCVEKNKI